jgi:hypothetical protein
LVNNAKLVGLRTSDIATIPSRQYWQWLLLDPFRINSPISVTAAGAVQEFHLFPISNLTLKSSFGTTFLQYYSLDKI